MKLCELREATLLTQNEVAKALNLAASTYLSCEKWLEHKPKNGTVDSRNIPSLRTMKKVAAFFFKKSVDDITMDDVCKIDEFQDALTVRRERKNQSKD